MIKSSFKTDTTYFTNAKRFINRADRLLADELAKNVRLAESEYLPILSTYPPPRNDTKFVWSFDPEANARARRWWFANLKKGRIPTDGKHYKRSGGYKQSWYFETSGLTVDIGSHFSKIRYVGGDMNGQGQVPTHGVTGWLIVAPVIEKATQFVQVKTLDAWEEALEGFGGAIEFV